MSRASRFSNAGEIRSDESVSPVGKRPWGVTISHDGRYVFTANGLSNDVSVVDVTMNRVVATIKVGQRPWGVAVAGR